MKKFNFWSLLLVALLVSVLSGCKNTPDRREDELEEKIEQLENKIATMEENAATTTGDSFNDAGSKEQSTDVMTTTPDITPDTVSDTMESLSKEVDKITTKIDSATPSQNEDEKRTNFFALKNELELVEDRIDACDDYMESQKKRGELSYEEYKSQERLLDELEDKLDASEDKLERTFGIYD